MNTFFIAFIPFKLNKILFMINLTILLIINVLDGFIVNSSP